MDNSLEKGTTTKPVTLVKAPKNPIRTIPINASTAPIAFIERI